MHGSRVDLAFERRDHREHQWKRHPTPPPSPSAASDWSPAVILHMIRTALTLVYVAILQSLPSPSTGPPIVTPTKSRCPLQATTFPPRAWDLPPSSSERVHPLSFAASLSASPRWPGFVFFNHPDIRHHRKCGLISLRYLFAERSSRARTVSPPPSLVIQLTDPPDPP